MFATIALALISTSYDNTELTKLIPEVWEHGNVSITKSGRAKKHQQSGDQISSKAAV